MTKKEIVLRLSTMDDGQMCAIVYKAVEVYFQLLLDIANDIYDSCIADYYGGYTPKYYNRHGNIEGWNLYNANSNGIFGGELRFKTDASKLEPYKGGSEDDVLGMVENGFRGGPGIDGWPKKWSTSYPNDHSAYHVWYSSGNTIEKITSDFQKNGIRETRELLWKCLEKCM